MNTTSYDEDMKFRVVYDGPALQEHRMDVRDLAPALLAFGELLEEANHTLNGEKSRLSVSVNASFKAGSFGIDLSVGTALQNILNLFSGNMASGANNLLGLLGFCSGSAVGLVQLIKWLKGRKISRVEVLQTGNVRVFVDHDSEEVDRRVIELFQNYKLRKALEAAVSKPLETDGIEDVGITLDEGKTFIHIPKQERAFFVAPMLEDEQISDTYIDKTLQLVSVSFKEDNKWRFTDGASTFYATVTDQSFLDAVNNSEKVFTKGDVLSVRLHIQQWLAGEELKTDYTVEQVLEHRSGARQINLPFSDA